MFTKLKKLINKIPRPVAALLVAALIVAVPITVHAWGPDRPTYDYTKYDSTDPTCRAPSNAFGRCGSMDGPVFDSFINAPTYGDERNFTSIAPVAKDASGNDVDPNTLDYAQTDQATAGQEYWVRTYVHNNANQGTNCLQEHFTAQGCSQIDLNAVGIAHDTHVQVTIPQGVASGFDIMSYISAKNSSGTPLTTVYDNAVLSNPNLGFSVSYVNGSAEIFQASTQNSALPLPDSIVSAQGAEIGFNQLDGIIPGCFQYVTYVYVKVKVSAPALTITKNVSANAASAPQHQINASLGNTLHWTINVTNTGSGAANDVTIRDTLPSGVTLVPGSIRILDAFSKDKVNGDAQADTALNSGGVNVGTYAPGQSGKIVFDTTINQDFKSCELDNVAYVHGSGIPDVSDQAKVEIQSATCQPPTPVTLLSATPPTKLVDTGAGSTIGLFAGVTVFGALAYRFFLSRRLARGKL